MKHIISKAARAVGACAVLALSVFSVAPTPAEACFQVLDYVSDCTVGVATYCSYNGDGSGGLYQAHYRVYYAC